MDYSEMYRILFQAQTNAIKILQNAQQEAEAIFVNEKEKHISVVKDKDGGNIRKIQKMSMD